MRLALLLPPLVLTACIQRKDPKDSEDTGDPGDAKGIAKYAVIVVPDGARLEETTGDETTWAAGYSDAGQCETTSIWPLVRDQFYPQAALIKPGYNTGITITAQAHSDLLTGNRQIFADFSADDGVGHFRPDLPTLFEEMRIQKDLDASGAVYSSNSIHLEPHVWSSYPGMGEDWGGTFNYITEDNPQDPDMAAGNDVVVIQDLQQQLGLGARFVIANLHQIDRAGHYNPLDYANWVGAVDASIANLWEWIQSDASGIKDLTVMVVVSDHGRHRWDKTADYPWQQHGDHCSGCREVPLLIAGPGINPGVEVTTPYILDDITRTLAWQLGLDMPYANGLVMNDVLISTIGVQQRSGPAHVSASGDLVAWQEWTNDPRHRSILQVDGEVIDDPSAIHIEDPQVVRSGDVDFVCWRQLTITPGDQYWKWLPKCMTRVSSGSWNFMDPIAESTWPYFSAAMAADPSHRLHIAWSGMLNGSGEEEAPYYLIRQTPDGSWEGQGEGSAEVSLPATPSILLDGDTTWVAGATSPSGTLSRYGRVVQVYKVLWAEGDPQTWAMSYNPDIVVPKDENGPFSRMENPAITKVGSTLFLAYHKWDATGTSIVTSTLADPSGSWSPEQLVGTGGRVHVHLKPAWSPDGWLYWARLGDEGLTEICRAAAGETTEDCRDTGFSAVDSIAVSPNGVWAVLANGDAQWQTLEVTW